LSILERLEGLIPMGENPVIEIEATFLTREQGGRETVPDLGAGRYMPHLIVQPAEARTAGEKFEEDYLGVAFVSGPEPLVQGQSGRFAVELMYHPRVNYASLEAGVGFTIREGAKVVGYGAVIRRPGLDNRKF